MADIMNIAELTPQSRHVDVKVHVIEKGPAKEVVSRKDGSTYKVAEILVGDPSGCILMSAWNDDITVIEEGKNYFIQNGYINVFKSSMRLNLGRNGQIEKIDEDIHVSQDVNMSEKEVEGRFKPRSNYKSGRRRY